MKTCPKCKVTIQDLQTPPGKLGCPNCYNVFRDEICAGISPIQLRIEHRGKRPERTMKNTQIETLIRRMNRAAARDDFEAAARLKSEIEELKDA